MENNKYKDADSNDENQSMPSTSRSSKKSSGESACETVHLKEGPWDDTKNDKHQNPEGNSIAEATDPSKLSQL